MISTCCVTNEAVAKSRKAAARAARTHGRVYLTGCAANLPAARSPGFPANVTVVPRPSEETAAFVAGDVGAIGCVQADARLDRVRAFVKIQDGCSFSCNFCVIPLVRGSSRSRSADAVLAEIRRRVAQGHREVVLTGINLGCFRDREAGYDLPRLVREAGEMPGLDRLRLSSIEINHVSDALVAALRETPAASRHLHVPLQSRRRRRAARDAPPLHRRHLPAPPRAAGRRVQPDERRDRRLPGRGRGGVRSARSTPSSAAGLTKVHVFPYSPRPGTVTAADDPVSPHEKRDRGARLRALSHELCRRRWQAKLGTADTVLVDRPGRGYGDDYSPWLARGTGRRARPRLARVRRHRGGNPCRRSVTTASSAGWCARAISCTRRDGFVAINDINPQAPVHVLVLPVRHVDTFRDVGEFDAEEAKRMLEFVAETAEKVGLIDYRVVVNVGPGGGQTVFHLHWHILGESRMSLIAELEADVKDAMRARDEERRDALRLILASLRSAEKDLLRPLSEDEELQVLQRERKKRIEAAEAFRAGGREEQAEKEEHELEILEEFMPEPLSEDELDRIVDDAIAENKATSMRDMGRVMADVMPQIAGRADGSAVSQLVREKLA